MINYKLKNTNTTNTEGNVLYIADTTGTYSIDNIGGYGAPNSERSDVALFLTSTYVGTKGELASDVQITDPLTVTQFPVSIYDDGWYKFNLLSLPVFDDTKTGSYINGSYFYDPSTNNIILYVGTKIVLTLDKVPANYIVASTDAFIVYKASSTKNTINGQISDLITNNVDFSNKQLIRLKDNYNAVRAILQGAVYEFCRGNKYVAQKNIEFLNKNDYVSV